MTLGVALTTTNNSIVLATDGLATSLDTTTGITAILDNVQKIIPLDAGCAMLGAGLAELLQPPPTTPQLKLLTDCTNRTDLHPDGGSSQISAFSLSSIETVNAEIWSYYMSYIIRQRYNDLFSAKNTSSNVSSGFSYRPGLSLVVAGFNQTATDSGKVSNEPITESRLTSLQPQLWSFSSTSNFIVQKVQENFVAVGAMGLANYLLRRFYIKDEMDEQRAALLAFYCIQESIFQNPALGGRIQIGYLRNGQCQLQLASTEEMLALEAKAKDWTNKQVHYFYF